MNRPLKFRVWEEETKKMTYLEELYVWEYGYCNGNFTTIGGDKISSIHRDIFTSDENVWRKESKERFIIQQFTGLLDKNSKEVYEGDVLRKEFFTDWEVLFENGAFKVRNTTNYPTYFIDKNDCKEREIIGNIFENGELLKNI